MHPRYLTPHGRPLVIGIGFLLLGVVLMLLWRLGGHAEFFRRRPETVDPAIIEAHPADGLVQVAAEYDARLIVVGSRGEKPVRAMLLGSTPYKLLHVADRPGLVVPG